MLVVSPNLARMSGMAILGVLSRRDTLGVLHHRLSMNLYLSAIKRREPTPFRFRWLSPFGPFGAVLYLFHLLLQKRSRNLCLWTLFR